MKILVIGSGGREHALCWSFKRSPQASQLYCAPGNAGIAQIAECVPIAADDIRSLANFAATNSVELTFVGGEVPLSLGVVDVFESMGLRIVGPRKAAAQLEASKAFAKDFMARYGIPTAKYVTAHSPGFALLELESGDFGNADNAVVIKADGLAAGKGVIVAANRREAEIAINALAGIAGTSAAEKIVVEECLTGREISLLAFVNGTDYALMPPVRDHKRIGDGDKGPNTGGMGTVTDPSLIAAEQIAEIEEKIIRPTLHGCVKEDMAFRGILFLGLMLTPSGPKLLEYNVRFGDPETQAILVRLETDFVDICNAMMTAERSLRGADIKWSERSSACVVLASEGYPQNPKTGGQITGLEEAEKTPGLHVFHSGTARGADGRFTPAGGRVLGVTATGENLTSALEAVYSGVGKISWPGMQYRKDIGR